MEDEGWSLKDLPPAHLAQVSGPFPGPLVATAATPPGHSSAITPAAATGVTAAPGPSQPVLGLQWTLKIPRTHPVASQLLAPARGSGPLGAAAEQDHPDSFPCRWPPCPAQAGPPQSTPGSGQVSVLVPQRPSDWAPWGMWSSLSVSLEHRSWTHKGISHARTENRFSPAGRHHRCLPPSDPRKLLVRPGGQRLPHPLPFGARSLPPPLPSPPTTGTGAHSHRHVPGSKPCLVPRGPGGQSGWGLGPTLITGQQGGTYWWGGPGGKPRAHRTHCRAQACSGTRG